MLLPTGINKIHCDWKFCAVGTSSNSEDTGLKLQKGSAGFYKAFFFPHNEHLLFPIFKLSGLSLSSDQFVHMFHQFGFMELLTRLLEYSTDIQFSFYELCQAEKFRVFVIIFLIIVK